MASVLRGAFLNDKTIDITGYDLELDKFDCSDGFTRSTKDFKYFVIPADEMKEISNKMHRLIESEPVVYKEIEDTKSVIDFEESVDKDEVKKPQTYNNNNNNKKKK